MDGKSQKGEEYKLSACSNSYCPCMQAAIPRDWWHPAISWSLSLMCRCVSCFRLASRHCCTANSTLIKLRVETRATFATIFVATEVARPHVVTTISLIVTYH